MFLTPLWDVENTSAVWQVYAMSKDGESFQVEDSLERWMNNPNTAGYADGIIATINHITSGQVSPENLLRRGSLCHEAIKGSSIFRIRKGVIRLYWFYGEGQKVIICPYTEEKRQDAVSKSTQRILLNSKADYQKAVANNEIVTLNNGENYE